MRPRSVLLVFVVVGLAVVLTGCPSAPAGITLRPAAATIEVGESLALDARVQPAKAKQLVRWASDAEGVASVGSTGLVMGIGVGTATITASSVADSRIAASAVVTVVSVVGNRAPVADAGADQVVTVGDMVVLDGGGSSDPDGDVLSFSWSFVAVPSGSAASLSDGSVVAPSFVADRVGAYEIRLTVSDGALEHSDALTVWAEAAAGGGAVLVPGGSVEGPDSVTLYALPGALDAPVTVHIERIPEHAITTPLAAALTPVGHVYRVRAEVGTLAADPSSGFLLGLPGPAGEAPDDLNVGFYLSGETIARWYPDHPPDEDVWEVVPGAYDVDLGQWVVSLHVLIEEGYGIGLAAGAYFVEPEAPAAVTTATGVSFHVRCRDEGVAGVCSSANTGAYAAALAAAHDTFSGLGFPYPSIATRHVLGLGPPTAYLYGFVTDQDGVHCNWMRGGQDGTPLGYYNSVTKNVVVCLDANGFTGFRESVTWHEYFHAVQYAHPFKLRLGRRGWILEGTAMVAEGVLDAVHRGWGAGQLMSRHDIVHRWEPWVLRAVDVGLREQGGGVEYATQDFWVFVGKWQERGMPWLNKVFAAGISPLAVSKVFVDTFGKTLSEAYWAWAKNQAFEKTVDLGGTRFSSSPRCDFDDRVATAIEVRYRPMAPASWSATLPPLTSAVFELVLEPGSEDYAVTVSVEDNAVASFYPHDDVMVKFYDAAEAGSFACTAREDARTHVVTVPQGSERTIYALVSNAREGRSPVESLPLRVDLHVARAEPYVLTITEPADGETVDEGSIRFAAELSGLNLDDRSIIVRWSDDGRDLATGESVETTRVCPGLRTVTATAEVRDLGISVSSDVRVWVEKLPPEVAITTDPRPIEIGAGDYLVLNGHARENVCGEPPTDLQRLRWRDGDGRLLGSGPGLLSQVLGRSVGSELEVVLLYTDDVGLTGSDGLVLQVSEPPEGGYPPRVVIDAPLDGAFFHYGMDRDAQLPTLRGRASDPEDGRLPDAALRWYHRRDGGEWQLIGEGNNLVYHMRYGGYVDVRLDATDSDGNTGSAFVRLFNFTFG